MKTQSTTNVSVVLLVEERKVLGRVATEHDQSMSAFVRNLVISAITRERPNEGRALCQLRRSRREHLLDRLARQLTLPFQVA